MVVNQKKIVVAGATGQLGRLVVKFLVERGANVVVLTRGKSDKLEASPAVSYITVDYNNTSALAAACAGADCVVSTLSGVREVIVDAQTKLLDAAIQAKVKRFIPSDFCIDYRNLNHHNNRNLDLRKEFAAIIDKKPIRATSILNGMFTDLLTRQAPVILFKQKRIFFWGNGDQKMDFTTIENTAEYCAAAALDDESPRWLSIAGDVCSMRDLQRIASDVTGTQFKLFRPGGLGAFSFVIKMTKTFAPGKNETFPAWQGMQYLYDMLTGRVKFKRLDNDRYRHIGWQKVRDVIKSEA